MASARRFGGIEIRPKAADSSLAERESVLCAFPDPREIDFCGRSRARDRARPAVSGSEQLKGHRLQIFVRDNNVDQALKALKRKMQREGIFREMKRRSFYEKPSEKKTREKAEGIRRSRKAARKLAQREGLLPAPKKKVFAGPGGPGRT
jgi:small subunit ribosomal protein S21